MQSYPSANLNFGGPPNFLPIFVTGFLFFLAIVMLVMTTRYIIVSGRHDAAELPVKCRQQRDQLKYIGILSFVTGALAVVHLAQREFMNVAIGGEGFEHSFSHFIGPLAESLILFEFGFFNLILCLICMMLVLARNSRVAARKSD